MLHTVALVIAARSLQLVLVDLSVALDCPLPGGHAAHEHPAPGTPDQMLQQIEYLGVAPGLGPSLLHDVLRQVPGLLVHYLRERHRYPRVLVLIVDPYPVLRGDVAGLAVPPGALVGLVAQDAVDLTVPPPLGLIGRGNAVGHQPLANHPRSQSVVHAHAVDAPHDLGLGLHYLGPAVVSDAVSVGDVADRNAPLLGRAPLAH